MIDKLTKTEGELLAQARAVAETISTKGWVEVIKPFLMTMTEWPNPKQFDVIDDVILPYTQAYGEAEAVRKLNQFIDSNIDMKKNLEDKLEGKDGVPSFEI